MRAYAKVNLHLEVLNKRSDSFHNIFSLNASLDLFDRLTFKRLNIFNNTFKDILIDIHPAGGEYADVLSSISTEDNLISKAAKGYLKHIGKSGEISVSIEKNIPAGAGLAGGSSDAAVILRFLNDHFIKLGEGLPENELLSLAAGLGADIPYCLSGGYAFCEGIGEEIENIEGRLKYWILVANCGIIVNTAEAYKSLKRDKSPVLSGYEIEKKKKLFRAGIKKGEIGGFKENLKNDFESEVFFQYPVLKGIKDNIIEYGAEYATMTGSGSSIIGIFKSGKKAETAKKYLEEKAKVYITKFL